MLADLMMMMVMTVTKTKMMIGFPAPRFPPHTVSSSSFFEPFGKIKLEAKQNTNGPFFTA